eukprot:64553-Hanusia_phi.AAC.2
MAGHHGDAAKKFNGERGEEKKVERTRDREEKNTAECRTGQERKGKERKGHDCREGKTIRMAACSNNTEHGSKEQRQRSWRDQSSFKNMLEMWRRLIRKPNMKGPRTEEVTLVAGVNMVAITVKCSTGAKINVNVELDKTVADLKKLLEAESGISPEQMRLIYRGHVLKDGNTLQSYCENHVCMLVECLTWSFAAVEEGHTIHLVQGTAAQSSHPTYSPSTSSPNSTTSSIPGVAPSMQSMQQQMMSDPQMMQQIMNSPMMQSLMNNPDLMRSLIQNNPQMQAIIEQNPEIGHVLNDPAILRQTMEAARSPELMREMMRTSDRAMSNIENYPEGFNMLRQMYHNFQEPMANAAISGSRAANEDTAAKPDPSNPFAELFQLTPPQPSANAAGPTGATPNPWAPAPSTTSGNSSSSNTSNAFGNSPFMGMGGGMGGLGGLDAPDGFGGDMDAMFNNPLVLEQAQQALRNPAVQQMMSDPNMLQQILNSNPALQQMLDANPHARAMLQDPEALRRLSDPSTLQSMMQMHQAMRAMQSGQQPSFNPSAFGQSNLFGGFPAAPVNPPSNVPPEERFRTQLDKLRDMGFSDQQVRGCSCLHPCHATLQANLSALQATNGNIDAAIDRLLSGMEIVKRRRSEGGEEKEDAT